MTGNESSRYPDRLGIDNADRWESLQPISDQPSVSGQPSAGLEQIRRDAWRRSAGTLPPEVER